MVAQWPRRPAKKGVARRLHEALPCHNSLPTVGVLRGSEIRLEHRSAGLLNLKKQQIVFVRTLHQHDHTTRTDRANTNNLDRRINIRVAIEEHLNVVTHRSPILHEGLTHHFGRILRQQIGNGGERHDQRWLRHDATLPIDDLGKTGHRLKMILPARTLSNSGGIRAPIFVVDRLQRDIDLELAMPRLERGHLGKLAHRCAITLCRRKRNFALPLGLKAAVARGDHHARHKALDIPLKRAR